MATVTKSVSGAAATFVITDNVGSTITVVSTTGLVTGNTTSFAVSAAVHDDALRQLHHLLDQLMVGIVPGSGAQGLT